MTTRIHAFVSFVRHFFRYVLYVREVIGGLLLLIVAGGFAISNLEGIELGEAMYFSFVTGLTIGYGDISPQTVPARVVSVAIGMVGMIFTGLTVAVATRALRDFAAQLRDNET